MPLGLESCMHPCRLKLSSPFKRISRLPVCAPRFFEIEPRDSLVWHSVWTLLGQCESLLLQYLLQSCLRVGGGMDSEDTCYERRRAEACVD